jgi:cysteinyl-tRNA synthetase
LVRLRKMTLAFDRLPQADASLGETELAAHPIMQRFNAAICDDLGTPRALVPFEEALAGAVPGAAALVRAMDNVLGLGIAGLGRADLRLRPKAAKLAETEIENAITDRNAARKVRDFATSDRLRDELAAQGVEVMDGDPLGWDWKLEE